MKTLVAVSLVCMCATSAYAADVVVESGVAMRSGDVKRAARVEFRLLKKDLAQWSAANDPEFNGLQFEANVDELSRVVLAAGKTTPSEEYLEKRAKKEAFLKAQSISVVTSDFNGKAVFKNIPPGKYFVYGVFKVFDNVVVWNYPINVKAGVNSVILDHNNAAD